MKIFLILLIINLILFSLLFIYSSCKFASKCDETLEKTSEE